MSSKHPPQADGEALAALKKKRFAPNLSMERQIAAHVRGLIHAGRLAPGTRLPPMRELAAFWGTNYFTVQAALSRLVAEGLIARSPKKGSFVAPARRALRRVCLYHDHPLNSDWTADFYTRLNVCLYRMLAERGIGIVPFFDTRPEARLHAMPPEIRDMAKDGEIDGLIASAIYPQNTPWLKKLEVPVASAMFLDDPRRLPLPNAGDFARLAVEEARRVATKTGRKTSETVIGLVQLPPATTGQPDALETALREALRADALAAGGGEMRLVLPEKVDFKKLHWERAGFRLCEELLKMEAGSGGPNPRPNVLFVYPDTLIRGVVTALLQRGVRVPGEVALVSHRNAESSIYVPFPVTWLTVRIEDYALGLLRQLEAQIDGEPMEPFALPVGVERTGEPK